MTSYTVARCDGEKDKFALSFTVIMLILCDTDIQTWNNNCLSIKGFLYFVSIYTSNPIVWGVLLHLLYTILLTCVKSFWSYHMSDWTKLVCVLLGVLCFYRSCTSTDTGHFDFLPSAYVRSLYKKYGFMKLDLYILYLLPKAINWCPERVNSTKYFVAFGK